LGLAVLYHFARRLFDEKTADYSVLMLLTTIGYVLVGRFAVIDMLMTFFLSASLLFLFTAFWERKSVHYLSAYACMGFGFLTKGLIGIVLPSGIFFMFLLWSGNLKELLKMKIHWGADLATVLSNVTSFQIKIESHNGVSEINGVDNVAFTSAVPEPASAVLLGLGLATVAWRRRRTS
jgi:4-amino-4-deoxy-L-arabinose transferase-like glycosyltransferase